MHEVDLIVIGAGPAGMAAARRAAGTGLSVLLLDDQPHAGGQIYRDVERASGPRGHILGADYIEGLSLVSGLSHPGITHQPGASVWQIVDGTRVVYTRNGVAAGATGQRLLMSTGALERPMPVPGWTLPGVMTAGAAQILFKQSGLLCTRAVLVGTGPLLYLVAVQMIRAGAPPLALVETQTRGDFMGALRHLRKSLPGEGYLIKGLGLLAELRRAGIPRHTGARDIAIEGTGRAEAVTFRAGGRTQRIACDTVLLHHGVVPNAQAARSLDIPHRWSHRQQAFVPERDDWGRTAIPTVFIAGDSAGIGGARAAALAGEVAALAVAADLDRISEGVLQRTAGPLRARHRRQMAVRDFLDTAYPPYPGALCPEDATVVCRCEEVTAGEIRRHAAAGCLGPNQAKAFGRAGMGPCQGRFCGLTVTALLAAANGRTPDETGYFRIRPPLKPVTLGELAAMARD